MLMMLITHASIRVRKLDISLNKQMPCVIPLHLCRLLAAFSVKLLAGWLRQLCFPMLARANTAGRRWTGKEAWIKLSPLIWQAALNSGTWRMAKRAQRPARSFASKCPRSHFNSVHSRVSFCSVKTATGASRAEQVGKARAASASGEQWLLEKSNCQRLPDLSAGADV